MKFITCISVLFYLASQPLFAQSVKEAKSYPNVLILLADDAGWKDFGCYGSPIHTPNIDKLAQTGIKFNNAFLTTSSCSPSRTSILTGQYAHSVQTEDMHVPLPTGIKILPSFLKEKGYYSGSMFKTHYGADAGKQFDWYSNKLEAFPAFLDKAEEKPFFMWVGFHDPHRPYNKKDYKNPFDPAKVIVPPYLVDDAATRQDLANYYSEIQRMDDEVGFYINELEKRGLRDNTLIVFLSDNGSPFPAAKGTVYDTGIGTPFIVNWKNVVKTNSVSDRLISAIDIAPTVLKLANISVPSAMLGKSLIPIIKGKDKKINKYVFSERNWHGIDEHMRSIRTLQYKLITNGYDDQPFGAPSDISSSPSWQSLYDLKNTEKLSLLQKRIFEKPRFKVELYDIKNDPDEINNLAGDKNYKHIKQHLLKKLKKWQDKTHDVAITDHVPADKTDRITGKPLKK